MTLPDLGVGLVHLPGLGPLLEQLDQPPDVIEVEPQAFWSNVEGERNFRTNRDLLERCVGEASALVHSVGMPIGGLSDGDPRQLTALRETLDCLKPPWWSDHASFVWANRDSRARHFGFLMPPVQSAESVSVIADRVKFLQDEFGLPFAFETGVSYLKRLESEWPDGVFWGAIADSADCGILLDLHNVWTNSVNGREPAQRVLADLPLERVWEVHVAGGHERGGVWLDAHSALPPTEVLRLLAEVRPRLPQLHAVIFEVVPDYLVANSITAEDLSSCLSELRELWQSGRGEARSSTRDRNYLQPTVGCAPTMAEWEGSLERAIHHPGTNRLFANEAGIEVYRDLIEMVRRGMVVEALPLSLRFLVLCRKEAFIDDLFHRFCSQCSAQPFMSDEASSFAAFVRVEVDLPHFSELLDFELAAHQVALTGEPRSVSFTCEPEPLLASLLAADGTLDIRPCDAHVEITPPTSFMESRNATGRAPGPMPSAEPTSGPQQQSDFCRQATEPHRRPGKRS